MADAEEDNIFEDEQKIIDYAEKEVLSEEDEEETEDSAAKRAKKEKKKRKFSEMKEKKLSARSSSSDNMSAKGDVMDARTQLDLLLEHDVSRDNLDLSEGNFLSLPSRDVNATTNPIVEAIDLAIPSRLKLLRTPDDTEDGCCSPAVLVICSGARRGCDVINVLSQNFKCKIGKLFAKHFRIQDQIEILKSTYFPVAVGTPNRLNKLVEMGALTLTQSVLVVVDLCEDIKGFNVMSLSDTKSDFYSFIRSCYMSEKDHIKMVCVKDKVDNNRKAPDAKSMNNKKRQGFNMNTKRPSNEPFHMGKKKR